MDLYQELLFVSVPDHRVVQVHKIDIALVRRHFMVHLRILVNNYVERYIHPERERLEKRKFDCGMRRRDTCADCFTLEHASKLPQCRGSPNKLEVSWAIRASCGCQDWSKVRLHTHSVETSRWWTEVVCHLVVARKIVGTGSRADCLLPLRCPPRKNSCSWWGWPLPPLCWSGRICSRRARVGSPSSTAS